jgi:predicted oxidoreductase
MKTQPIHNTSLVVTRIAFGCMRLPAVQSDALRSIHTALDEGINFFDHANVYQRGQAEETFSALWADSPNLRQKIILQSKCGIRNAGDPPSPPNTGGTAATPPSIGGAGGAAPKRYDFSYQHIIESVNGSLKRLKTDYLDILLLHRPDPLVEPEEVARAFSELRAAGKVRYFGVSNHTGAQIELLKTAVTEPLVVNQLEISVLHPTLINAGVIFNQDKPLESVRGEGALEYCRTHKITVQPWSPLARGVASGRAAEDPDGRIARTLQTVDALAGELGVSREAVLIAWLLRHPAKFQPIIGTMNPQRIANCCQADRVEMTREQWWRLFGAGRGGDVT